MNEIARRLEIDRRTVQDYLSDAVVVRISARRPGAADELLEAGLAYLTSFETAPSSRNWNATHARRDGPETYARSLLGWVAQADADVDPPVIRRWPSPGTVARTFGSFPAFVSALQREVVRRERAGTPYVPVPLPTEHVSTVSIEAMCRERWGPEYPGAVLEQLGGGLPDARVEAGELSGDEQLAVGSIDGAPFQLPRLEHRQGVAVLGSPGVGKTSVLLRIAISDAIAAPGRVAVVESDGILGAGMFAMEARRLPWPGPGAWAGPEQPGPPAFAWAGAGEGAAVRAAAIHTVAKLADRTKQRMSLVVDDADDVLEALVEVAERRLENLVIHAAWMPTGTETDKRLLAALPSFFAFRIENYLGAKLVVDHFKELYEDSGPDGDAEP